MSSTGKHSKKCGLFYDQLSPSQPLLSPRKANLAIYASKFPFLIRARSQKSAYKRMKSVRIRTKIRMIRVT